MADFVHPTTLQIVLSVNDKPAPWIVCTRANALSWGAIPSIYRKWVTDHIEEMTAGEKSTKDAAILTAARDAVTSRIDAVEAIERAVLLVILDELNTRATEFNDLLAQIAAASSLSDLKNRVAAQVAQYPTRTTAQLRTAIRNKLGS